MTGLTRCKDAFGYLQRLIGRNVGWLVEQQDAADVTLDVCRL